MKRLLSCLILWSLSLSVPSAFAAPILLKSRTIDGGNAAAPWSALAAHAGRHVLVQFAQTPDAAARAELAAQGVHLLAPVPRRAFLAYVEPRDWAAIESPSPFTLATALAPEDKLHPRLVSGEIDDYAFVPGGIALTVKFFADVAPADRAAQLDAAGAELVQFVQALDLAYVVAAAPEDAWLLAEQDGVEYVTLPEPAWGFFNDKVRVVVQAPATHEPPYSVTGAGVKALVYDGGVVAHQDNDAIHPDLQGRLQYEAGIPDITGHANHVSCTVAGNGALSDGTYAGMAPEAEIISMDFTQSMSGYPFVGNAGDMDASYHRAVNQYGAQVANNSIGANLGQNQMIGAKCEWMGDYTVAASLIDQIVGGREGKPIILVWAAGNEVTSGCPGTFQTIPPPSPAKNTISVGAVSSLDEEIAFFSSRGPTDDGRLRPDVAAPGHEKDGLMMKGTHSCVTYGVPLYMDMSGTSQASPVVTGAVALTLEYWQREIGGDDPAPALVKALVIHGAVDLGNKGPDYTYGFGGLRIPPILELIGARAYQQTSLDQGQEYRAQFTKTEAGPVKVTLVWTDPAGEVLSARNLVNDLDLTVSGPDRAAHLPWLLDPAHPAQAAATGVDSLNPVEQVFIEDAPLGDYEVVIKATDVPAGPQAVSYVFTGLTFESEGGDDDDNDDASPGDDDDDDDDNDDSAQSGTADDDDNDDGGGCGC